jgi:hypothetical protein
VVLSLFLLVVCALAAGIAFIFKDKFDTVLFPPTETFTEVQIPSPTLPIVSTDTPRPTDTPIPSATPTLTATASLVFTPTIETPQATGIISTTQPLTNTLGLIGQTQTPSAPNNILDEDFGAGWERDWIIWGEPKAGRDIVFGDAFLKLAGEVRMAGVSYRMVIPLRPGIVLEFLARLPEESAGKKLVFDWDQGDGPRKPDEDPGNVNIEIEETRATLKALSPQNCQLEIQGATEHTYVIRVSDSMQIVFLVDGDACPLTDSGLDRGSAWISFSGQGWVSYVKAGMQ